jgi:hypothetical protein
MGIRWSTASPLLGLEPPQDHEILAMLRVLRRGRRRDLNKLLRKKRGRHAR